jgi:hypothetical protein
VEDLSYTFPGGNYEKSERAEEMTFLSSTRLEYLSGLITLAPTATGSTAIIALEVANPTVAILFALHVRASIVKVPIAAVTVHRIASLHRKPRRLGGQPARTQMHFDQLAALIARYDGHGIPARRAAAVSGGLFRLQLLF